METVAGPALSVTALAEKLHLGNGVLSRTLGIPRRSGFTRDRKRVNRTGPARMREICGALRFSLGCDPGR